MISVCALAQAHPELGLIEATVSALINIVYSRKEREIGTRAANKNVFTKHHLRLTKTITSIYLVE